ncbi:MAG: ABC transporter ATP-binding protein [Coriobacteriia bacterium]|nr:ABC transporter ATP-binding protein [Coriobacteriia bacterium]
MLPRADVSIGRIEEVLKHKLRIDNFTQETKVSGSKANDKEYIKFENVSYEYDETKHKIFKDINFAIKKNSINAIVGPTGTGKSTLLKLLLRYYDVSSGKITIDGVDVKDFNEKDLRSTISYVPQKVILFQGTLDENVSLNKTIAHNAKRAEESLRFANMGDFIDSNEEGMDYVVSQGARNLSGGQKQRVSIARSVYEDAPIMLLDDPFSALDANTEKIINDSLQKDFKETTILVVTQRLSSVVNYDNIIFIYDGKIEAIGTHKELMKNKHYKFAFDKALSPTIEDVK